MPDPIAPPPAFHSGYLEVNSEEAARILAQHSTSGASYLVRAFGSKYAMSMVATDGVRHFHVTGDKKTVTSPSGTLRPRPIEDVVQMFAANARYE